MSEYPSLRRSRARIAQKVQTARILIKCFEDEKKALIERARSVNKSLSAYLRDCALPPIPLQSSAIPESNSETEETLLHSNIPGEEQTFVHKSAVENRGEESFSKQVASETSGRDLASERTGHVKGCVCFACERLRAMLQSSEERKKPKGKR